MKKRYSISFFVVILLCLVMLSFAYQVSYDHQKEQANLKQNEQISIPTEGNAAKAEVYYLKDLNGFVAVYQNDKKTIYEYTDIRIDELPEEIAGEVRSWKAIETVESLYGFLENYSS